jgi:hypothetical protein
MRDAAAIRWGVAQRFEFIEWKAYWDGRLNRGDLEREFAISTPQASVDLRNYQEAAPGNIEYDSSEKAYVATGNFHPQFLALSPQRYLRQLHGIKTRALDATDTWFDAIPPVDVVPNIAREPEAYTLRAVLKAIRMQGSIEVFYRSLTNTRNRVICPHALGHDGYRWHVRAWCTERQEYRDYVLGRILSVFDPQVCESDPPEDVEWNTFTKLILVAHPELDANQRAAVERDFRMDEGHLSVTLRVALAFYFVRRYNLDLRNNEIAPNRAQLFIKNYEEFEAHCAVAKEQARALSARNQLENTGD